MAFIPRFICGEGHVPSRQLHLPECLQVIADLHNAKQIKPLATAHSMIPEMLKEGFLNYGTDGTIFRNAMVIRDSDGLELFALAKLYSQSVREILEQHLDAIKTETGLIAEFQGKAFASHSFFILSNVLLDNWQIRAVEDLYLHQERPLRGGKRFYFAIMEDSTNEIEPFGIYGNFPKCPSLILLFLWQQSKSAEIKRFRGIDFKGRRSRAFPIRKRSAKKGGGDYS